MEKELKEMFPDLKDQMSMWRQGLISFPVEYIDQHSNMANASLDELESKGAFKVHNRFMKNSGDGDGMRCLVAIIEMPNEELKKIKWYDTSSTTGQWMERCQGGGWGLITFDASAKKVN